MADGSVVAAAPPSVSTGRSAAIAWLRVLAIVGVICVHTSAYVITQDDLRGTKVYALAAVMNGATRFCVPLFVLVSGALVLRPSSIADGFAPYYRKRFARIIPPLVVWHLVYVAFRVWVRGWAPSKLTLVAVILTAQVYTALYFFWIIVGLYLVAPLLVLALDRLTARQRLVVGLALTGVTCLWQSTLGVIAATGTPAEAGTQNIVTIWVPYVGYFVLGWALREVVPSRRTGWWALLVAIVTACLLSFQATGLMPVWVDRISSRNYWGWLVAIETVALFLAAWWFLRGGTWAARGRVGRLGDTLGSLTLGVFAVHLIVLWYVGHALAPGLTKGHVGLLGLLAVTAATVVISWAVAWAMSKVPYLRRLV